MLAFRARYVLLVGVVLSMFIAGSPISVARYNASASGCGSVASAANVTPPDLGTTLAQGPTTPQANPYDILLKSGTLSDKQGVDLVPQPETTDTMAEPFHVLIQFDEMPTEAQVAAWADVGLILLDYLPDRAWYATVDPTSLAAILNVASPRWLGEIQPIYKIEPDLLDALPDPAENILLSVDFYEDVPNANATGVVAKHGAVVIEVVPEIHQWIIMLPSTQVMVLAAEDAVQWIDFGPTPKIAYNDCVRWRVRAEEVWAAPYGLDGTGVKLGMWDNGGVYDHVDFTGRLTVFDGVMDEHPAHVAGTMAGDGTGSTAQGGTAGQWAGIAPAAQIYSWSFGFLSAPIGDFNAAINTHGIQLSQNSWGVSIGNSNCDQFGSYTSTSSAYDAIVTGSEGKPITVVFAAGNFRNDGDTEGICLGELNPNPPYINYGNIGPISSAKNIITVGATNSDDDSMTEFSSWGPVDDGRIKPEVVAPGDEANGSLRVRSPVLNDNYGIKRGTSMSAPVVSGIAGLILQDYAAQFGAEPLPSSIKGLLIHTAVDLDDATIWYNPGPDYASGYGRVDAVAAIDALRNGAIHEDDVDHGGDDTWLMYAGATGNPLKVTLVWDDPAGAASANPALVNNLDLWLVSPTGTTYRPWVLDKNNPSNDATTGIDTTNNVEQVFVAVPETGTWTIHVAGISVTPGGQSYSLLFEDENVLPNLSLEAGGTTPDGWRLVDAAPSTASWTCNPPEAYTGNCAIHLTGTTNQFAAFFTDMFEEGGEAGESYEIFAHVRGESYYSGLTGLGVLVFREDGSRGKYYVPFLLGGDFGWQQFSLQFTTQAPYKKIRAGVLVKPNGASFWVDDISLVRMP